MTVSDLEKEAEQDFNSQNNGLSSVDKNQFLKDISKLYLVGSKQNKQNDISQQQQQEIEEIRELLVFAAQEGDPSEVKDYYNSLDEDKVALFVEQKWLNTLPYQIIEVVLNDFRPSVQEVLKNNENLFTHPNFFTVEDWAKKYNFTSGEIIKNGRKVVAKLLQRAQERIKKEERELLREKEITAIENMARNIPDKEVINVVVHFAKMYPTIASNLIKNPILKGVDKDIDPQEQSTLIKMVIRELIKSADICIKNEDALSVVREKWTNLIKDTYQLSGQMKVQNESRETKSKILEIIRRHPAAIQSFIGDENIDTETIRQIISIDFIKNNINNKEYLYIFKNLRSDRYKTLTKPMIKELEKNSEIKKFFTNPFNDIPN